VAIADTDVLLVDACTVLASGCRSPILRAIAAGSALVLMSEVAFHELGRMSAPAARSHGIHHEALRALLEAEYLPRIPVVTTPPVGGPDWMPDASDIRDPDDVPHVQLARLVSATIVLSHDKDLRRPGLAPRIRRDYDVRLEQLGVLSAHREAETTLAIAAYAVGGGAHLAVTKVAASLRITTAALWSLLGFGGVVAGTTMLRDPFRRAQLCARLEPLVEEIGLAMEAKVSAVAHLGTTSLPVPAQADRLEVGVASLLVRTSDMTTTEIASGLGTPRDERRNLSELLASHPCFEQSGRSRWAVGRVRSELETRPPTQPRIATTASSLAS
jgi:predicted nucleic acid-binding protein